MFFAWQVNFTLTEHGHSSVPYWLAVLVTVLVSTVGVDAVLVRAEDPAPCHSAATAPHCTALHDTRSLLACSLPQAGSMRMPRAGTGPGQGLFALHKLPHQG